MAFMHLYMKYTQPLFIQGIMPLKSLYDSKVRLAVPTLSTYLCTSSHPRATLLRAQILKIHLLGKPATGDLKRPFEAPPSLFGAPAKTDQAAEPAKVEAKKDK